MLVAKTLLSNIYLVTFAFLITKITMLGQQLVRPVICICYHFSACKNCNLRAIMPVQLVKIVTK